MERNCSPFKRSILGSDSGFTLIELLVTMMLGTLITALTIGATLSNRNIYQLDLVRTRLNQNLKGAMDVIGMDVREAGENLIDTFPAVEIIDGAPGEPDELILRRNLIDEVLKVCTQIDSGSGDNRVFLANASGEAGCDYASNTHNYQTWQNYRTDHDNSVRVFIYDIVAKEGEFFDYDSETDEGVTDYSISRSGGAWEHTYEVGSSSVYIIEEWRFKVDKTDPNDGLLQLIENGDDENPQNVVAGITDFQVRAHMQDGTVQDDLPRTDRWADLKSVEVTLTGRDYVRKEPLTRVLTARYFPRNILSN